MKNLVPRSEAATALRIVLVDADPDTKDMYREALRLMPVELVEAADGRDALVKCLIQRPALVVTDTQLPILDGYALCELLRRDALTRLIPILVVTSESRPAELARVRQLGATSVVSKPISMDGFVSEVARLCDGSAASQPPQRDNGPSSDASNETSSSGSTRAASRTFRRFETTAPPRVPPAIRCADCDGMLSYHKSRVGGVTQRDAEQWDEFRCLECHKVFEYRHRTRKLRAVT